MDNNVYENEPEKVGSSGSSVTTQVMTPAPVKNADAQPPASNNGQNDSAAGQISPTVRPSKAEQKRAKKSAGKGDIAIYDGAAQNEGSPNAQMGQIGGANHPRKAQRKHRPKFKEYAMQKEAEMAEQMKHDNKFIDVDTDSFLYKNSINYSESIDTPPVFEVWTESQHTFIGVRFTARIRYNDEDGDKYIYARKMARWSYCNSMINENTGETSLKGNDYYTGQGLQKKISYEKLKEIVDFSNEYFRRYTGKYHLLWRNCNTFARDVCKIAGFYDLYKIHNTIDPCVASSRRDKYLGATGNIEQFTYRYMLTEDHVELLKVAHEIFKECYKNPNFDEYHFWSRQYLFEEVVDKKLKEGQITQAYHDKLLRMMFEDNGLELTPFQRDYSRRNSLDLKCEKFQHILQKSDLGLWEDNVHDILKLCVDECESCLNQQYSIKLNEPIHALARQVLLACKNIDTSNKESTLDKCRPVLESAKSVVQQMAKSHKDFEDYKAFRVAKKIGIYISRYMEQLSYDNQIDHKVENVSNENE